MTSADRVSAVAPHDLTRGDSTPGIVREVAFATDRALHVRGRVNGGVVSGWHHHGDREVLGYVERATTPSGHRFIAKRMLQRQRRFLPVGEFWTVDDAMDCFRF